MTRYVIIGSGITGFSAARSLQGLDPQSEILMVSEDPHGFYSRPGLAYFLTGEIPEKQLFLFSKKGRINLDIRLIKAHVTGIDPAAHTIDFDSPARLVYDRLLLATGASSVPLNVPGSNLQGIVKLDDLEDTLRILSLVRHGKNAVVVGGGVVGIELVEGLVAHGIKVHYLLRGDRFWPNVLGEVEAKLVEQHLTHDGVRIHHNTEVEQVLGRRGKVTGVRTSDGMVLPCDLVAVGIGVKARMELAQAAGLKTDRGVLVDEFLESSVPDVFAAGDTAQIFDPLTGNSSIDNLWFPGRKQGGMAANNMAGRKLAYKKTVAMNVLRLAGVMTTIIGAVGTGRDEGPTYTMRGSSESWLQLPNTIATESGTSDSHLRLIVSDKFLLGALIMGDQKISKPLCDLIRARVDISSIRNDLLQSESRLGTALVDFWTKNKQEQPRVS